MKTWMLAGVLLFVTACTSDSTTTTQQDADTEAPESTTTGVIEETTTAVPETTTTAAPDPTTTAAPETTTTPAAAGAGTREDPIPLGEAAQVGNYTVTVTSWNPDATESIVDFNEFVELPPEGMTNALAGLAFSYDGDETGTAWLDLSWGAVGDAAVAYDAGECYTYPENISDVTELFPGGSAEANVCLTIDPADTGIVLFLEESFSLDGGRVFFALE